MNLSFNPPKRAFLFILMFILMSFNVMAVGFVTGHCNSNMLTNNTNSLFNFCNGGGTCENIIDGDVITTAWVSTTTLPSVSEVSAEFRLVTPTYFDTIELYNNVNGLTSVTDVEAYKVEAYIDGAWVTIVDESARTSKLENCWDAGGSFRQCDAKNITVDTTDATRIKLTITDVVDAGANNINLPEMMLCDRDVVAVPLLECSSQDAFCDNFNYASSLYDTKGWIVQKGFGIDTDVTPTNNELVLNGTFDGWEFTQKIGLYPLNTPTESENVQLTSSYYTPVASSEFNFHFENIFSNKDLLQDIGGILHYDYNEQDVSNSIDDKIGVYNATNVNAVWGANNGFGNTGGYYFNTGNSYITLDFPDVLNETQHFTIMGRFKLTSINTQTNLIQIRDSANKQFVVSNRAGGDSGKIWVDWDDTTKGITLDMRTTNAVMEAGKYQHLAITYDGTKSAGNRFNIMVDGDNVTYTTDSDSSPTFTNFSNNLNISTNANTQIFYNDNFVILNQTLTNDDIKNIYFHDESFEYEGKDADGTKIFEFKFILNQTELMDIEYLNSGNTYSNLCKACLNGANNINIKINTFFDTRTRPNLKYYNGTYNDSVTLAFMDEDTGNTQTFTNIPFYNNNVDDQRILYFKFDHNDDSSIYSYHIDDYHVYSGTDKDIYTLNFYTNPTYDTSSNTSNIADSDDLQTSINSLWDLLGLKSQTSKTIFGLFLLVICSLFVVGFSVQHGGNVNIGAIVIIDIFLIILFIFIGLLPVWILLVLGMIGAGILAWAIKNGGMGAS